jgi:1,5-anhydro-D-fructose reductase (1,5-anhydro-D-mannitol-forming)
MKTGWGLIGCGDIARKRVAPALRDIEASDFVAVSRSNFEKAEEFAREFGARRWYKDWRELIRDDEISAVYVATPVHLHAEQAIAAAEAGLHILCEKPMAMTTAECSRMIEAAEANGVKLGIAYYRRFYPVIDRLKSIIESGEIGKPVMVQLNAFEKFDPAPSNPRGWLLKKEISGGGPMFDFGCHRIEVLINLFGFPWRTESLTSNHLLGRDVEDTATAVFQFDNGAQGVLSVSHAAQEPQDTLMLFGTTGTARIPVLNSGNITVSNEAGEQVADYAPHKNVHQPLIEDFIDAIANNRGPKVDGRLGLDVNRVLEDIYRENEHR